MDYFDDSFKDLEPLQKKHCEILSYIDKFCTLNGIEWCLAYGSALGAQRHGGPIPWDDDADIYMTAQGYEKFREAFHSSGDHEHFYLQEMDCVDGMLSMPKLRMNGTTFIDSPMKNMDIHHGIYVDIFLLHGYPPTKWDRLKGILSTSYIVLKRMSNHYYSKRKIIVPVMKFLRLFPKRFGLKTAYRQLYKWDSQPSDKVAEWECYIGDAKWAFERDVIFPVQRIAYSGYQFCVPNQNEKYLSLCYGDWEKIPDLNHVLWNQHAVNWSTTQDFREVAPNIHDFRDEII